MKIPGLLATDIYRRIRERLNGKHPKKHLVRIGETKRRTRDEFTQCHNEDWRNWVIRIIATSIIITTSFTIASITTTNTTTILIITRAVARHCCALCMLN